ncbi:DUF1992 domain-containing protein [Paenibacillus oryzisoli]|uniref:DnaJ family domain-containing protein n=1 Tax=Paenibacillus oryzisoli TaxID=1850517 RepID=UPI003D27B4CA
MEFIHSLAEDKIAEAIHRGEFKNLPGAGKPLPPDELANVPEELRIGFKLLKNAGLIPEEMQLRKDILKLSDLIAICRDSSESRKLHMELSTKRLRYQSLMEGRGWHASETFTAYEDLVRERLTTSLDAQGAHER